jgi:hypothetical protein
MLRANAAAVRPCLGLPVAFRAEDSPRGLWRSLGKRVGLTALAGSNPASSAGLHIGLCNYSRRRSIEHDADLARGSLIGDAVGLRGLLELIAMRDNAFRMKVPANQVLEQVLHVTQ